MIDEALELSGGSGIADLHGMAAWDVFYAAKL
jgi:hypothetical protein